MAVKKTCANCGNRFLGRADASYCSPACRQRARRGKPGDKCDTAVTDKPRGTARRPRRTVRRQGHCEEAQSVLDGLDQELASNARKMGRPLQWSTAEVEVRRLIAETIDRKVDLASRWADADDKTALKLSGELRLLEASIARLLKQVKTDMPVSPTQKSQKAARAANARWEHT